MVWRHHEFIFVIRHVFQQEAPPLLTGGFFVGYNDVVKITIPIPEKVSLNRIYSGIHFRTRAKHKGMYHMAVLSSRPKPYTGSFPVSCHYHFKLNGSRLDVSNHAYMQKMIEDALVAYGVLPDDTQAYVSQIVITGEYVPKGRGQNEVEVQITAQG